MTAAPAPKIARASSREGLVERLGWMQAAGIVVGVVILQPPGQAWQE